MISYNDTNNFRFLIRTYTPKCRTQRYGIKIKKKTLNVEFNINYVKRTLAYFGNSKRSPRVPLFISCLLCQCNFVNWMHYNNLFYKQVCVFLS